MAAKCLHYKIIHCDDTWYQVKYKTGWFWRYLKFTSDAGSNIESFPTYDAAMSRVHEIQESIQSENERRNSRRGVIESGSLDV